MGTTLTGKAIKDTYQYLLKTTDNTTLSASLKVISDGNGNDSALQLSTGGVKVTGTFDVGSASSIVGLNSFGTISAGGTSILADQANDTLTIGQGNGIQISGNATSDTFNVILTATTTQVPEGTNLYYTDNRVRDYLTGGTLEYIDFNSTAPQQEVVEGQIAFNVDEGVFDFGLENGFKHHSGVQELIYVKNQTGSQINKGQVVQAAGTLGTSGRILVSLFTANEATETELCLGIAGEDIPNGSDGYVVSFGKVRGLNTGTWTEGSILWASSSTAGGLTQTQPSAPNGKVHIAFVVKTGTTNGEIFVRVETGEDLYQNKRVQVSSITNNQILQYKTNRFENVSFSAGTGIGITHNPTNIAISYTGASGGVTSIESLTGAIDISGGTGIGISTAGQSVNITNNGVTSLQSLTGGLTFSGNGISIGTSGSNTITLSAATGGGGGSTNSFGTIAVPTQSSIVADQVNEVLTMTGTSGIVLTTSASTGTLYISQNIANADDLTTSSWIYWDGAKFKSDPNVSLDSINGELTFDVLTFFNGEATFNGGLKLNSNLQANSIELQKLNIGSPSNGNIGIGSQITYIFTGTSLTAGAVYAVNTSGGLTLANNTSGTSKDMLVIPLGTSATTEGVLLNGTIKVSTSLTGASIGQKVYISNSGGALTTTAPTASGSVVRIVGYVIEPSKSTIYFNPDTSWVENI